MEVRIAAPLWVERIAVRRARTAVVHTGMGPRRSLRRVEALQNTAVLVAGVGGGLARDVRVGDLVVASEVHAPEGTVVPCTMPELLVAELHRAGLIVHYGPIGSCARLVDGAQRERLAAAGAYAVDMESCWLAPSAGTPFAVVRAISDTQEQSPRSPAVVTGGLAALRTLRRAVPALDAWAEAIAAR